MKVKLLSRVRPSATPWTAAYQAPLPMGFSRQEYWSGVPLPSPENGTDEPNLQDRTREADIGNRLVDTAREGEGGVHRESSTDICIFYRK